MEKLNLMNLSLAEMEQYFISKDYKKFHAKQIFKWIHQKGIVDFDLMTDLSKKFREDIKTEMHIIQPKVVFSKASADGTHKWLIEVKGGSCVEAVYIPENSRGTLCVSSQVGCTLNCSFCSTGKQGFNRNLTTAEIIGQLWSAVNYFAQNNLEYKVTNIVMMGMGEPLMNFDNVVSAMNIMLDDTAYGISKRRLTLSTSGVVPRIYELLEKTSVSLAVSLHAANDELRNELVPINRKYNIDMLLDACLAYAEKGPHRDITFEYTLMAGINDQAHHANELVELLKSKNVPSKINLIPFNPYPGTIYTKPSNNQIHRFKDILVNAGYIATIRKTRGDDIDAACGQLVGSVEDITKRQQRNKLKILENNRV